MSKTRPTPAQNSALDSVKQRFDVWRSNKSGRKRIPDFLWQAATSILLSGGFSLNKIARNLRLNHSELKKHACKQPSGFIQPMPEPSPTFVEIEPPSLFSECIIEMERDSGTKVRMCFRGKADPGLIELGKYFLRDQA
ncbi:MAG: hypothetical protein KKD21_13245 [Proteobacteria bacterium]|nr:hypothetical protein [Pseudomonadota bacterium]